MWGKDAYFYGVSHAPILRVGVSGPHCPQFWDPYTRTWYEKLTEFFMAMKLDGRKTPPPCADQNVCYTNETFLL